MSSYKQTTVRYIDLPEDEAYLQQPFPWVFDDFSLALRLGVRCKTLWYCVRRKEYMYKRFTIPKRSGGRRPIHAPEPVIKHIQKKIHEGLLKSFPLLDCVGAYVDGKSCVDSALLHVGSGVCIHMDLKNFFPSHSRARVRQFLKTHYNYNHPTASLLADLCTVQEGTRHYTPQGSPASPMLCNLMAQETLDRALLESLGPLGWVYTRYSDDIELSHKDDLPSKVVNNTIRTIVQLAKDNGYRVNSKKTKVQRRWRQQKMLGIVINEKPNIPRNVYRRYRAILHNCLHNGDSVAEGLLINAIRFQWDPPESFLSHLEGKISYFASISDVRGAKLKKMLGAVKLALAAEEQATTELAKVAEADDATPNP